MGVGINEANRLGGALAAVGVASRMIGDEANHKISEGAKAQDSTIKIGEEMPEIKQELENASKQMTNVTNEKNALNDLNITSPEDVNAFEELKAGVDKDEKMAKVALDTVQGKIKARKALLLRNKKAMDAGRAWGGNY